MARNLILSLVSEHETFYGAGEAQGMTDDEIVENFLGNHHPELVNDAVKGDVSAIVQLRTALGLPTIR